MLSEWGEWQRRIKREIGIECGYGRTSTKAIIDNIMMINARGTGSVVLNDVSISPWLVDVNRWVCSLDEMDREILVMFFVERYSIRSISRYLRISRRKVNTQIQVLESACMG